MKGRESGMPDEAMWKGFFAPEAALDRLITSLAGSWNIVEFGCGYGTFTLPAARRTDGVVTALDIDPEMISCVRRKAANNGLTNVRAVLRDIAEDGTGLPDESQSHAMLFNLLHMEHPVALLREARRVLQPGGRLSVIHWRNDIPTPRGPSQAIRPTAEQCAAWIEAAGFGNVEAVNLEHCCPYHYGLIASRED